jgi:hypothetical protein
LAQFNTIDLLILQREAKGKAKKAKRSGLHEPPTRNGDPVDRFFKIEAEI